MKKNKQDRLLLVVQLEDEDSKGTLGERLKRAVKNDAYKIIDIRRDSLCGCCGRVQVVGQDFSFWKQRDII